MSFYKVLLEGKNFLIEHEGKKKLHGFFTTRWVKARNSEFAELTAVELVKNDEHLIALTINKHGSDPDPMVYLEEINTVSWLTYLRRKPGKGYSFYLGEEEES